MALVRPEEPRDRDASLQVERLAFGSDEEPGIVEAVRDEEESFALVAEEYGAVVGHVQSAGRGSARPPSWRSARWAWSRIAKDGASGRS